LSANRVDKSLVRVAGAVFQRRLIARRVAGKLSLRVAAMTAVFEKARRGEDAPHRVTAGRKVAILAKLADLWPQTLLAVGAILTLLWSGGLLWLLLMILGLI
jgi:hypothetical protein